MRRIEAHPILTFATKRKIRFLFEGKELDGYEGEPIASALVANGVTMFRESPDLHRPR
ncbi:MAG: 2Fe-2S iron-sulfur cluster-binding protein, partial [bacterium]